MVFWKQRSAAGIRAAICQASKLEAAEGLSGSVAGLSEPTPLTEICPSQKM